MQSISVKGQFLASAFGSLVCASYVVADGLDNLIYLSLFSINCFICIWHLFSIDGMPFSIKMMVNFYIFIFFILANGIQFAAGSNVLTFTCHLDSWDFIHFQCVIFFIIVLFNYMYSITPSIINIGKSERNNRVSISEKKLLIVAGLLTLFILVRNNFNLFQLFFRSLSEEFQSANGIVLTTHDDSSSMSLIIEKFIRPVPWACFIISLIYNKNISIQAILGGCTLITVFPLGIARNAAAMYWIPIMVIIMRKWIKGLRFVMIMVVGIIIIFPLLDNFRDFTGTVNLDISLRYLNSMNFDASEIMMATIKTGTVTYGHQLLGALLFFVPRSIWYGKPTGSGHFLVTESDGFFTNVSMPFFSEGFINFGYIGILLFVIGIAIFAKKTDSFFWRAKIKDYRTGIYYVLVAAMTFILRGDLMSSYSYTVATCFCVWFIFKITSRRTILTPLSTYIYNH